MYIDRREYLLGLGTAATVAVAGCGSNQSEDEEEPLGESDGDEDVFEGLRINGRPMSAENPVELHDTTTDEIAAQVHWHGESGEWHFAPLELPVDSRRLYDIKILDPDLEEIPSGDGTEFQFEITTTEETQDGLITADTFNGIAAIETQDDGSGELVVHILHNGDRIWSSPPLAFEIGQME